MDTEERTLFWLTVFWAVLWIVVTAISGCSSNPYAIDQYLNVTHYSINYTQKTPQGIGVDADNMLSLTDIDRRTNEVEACLSRLYPTGELPANVVHDSVCIQNHFDTHIDRAWVGVKLAPDWFRSCYAEDWQYVGPGLGEEIFPAAVDPKLCEAKGFIVTPECPCGARAMIQDNSTIVTAPNMHLYKSELIRLVTGCDNIWTTNLQTCWTAD